MKLASTFIFATLISASTVDIALADMVVVMNAQSGVERLSADDVTNIFLGRYRRLPSGASAIAIDQPADSGLKAAFYRQLVNKDLAEINSYWARVYFSGKTSPPNQAASQSEVLDLLARTPGGIAYMERKQVDARLKIVLDFSP